MNLTHDDHYKGFVTGILFSKWLGNIVLLKSKTDDQTIFFNIW